jgi:large subunit ribosomal protein L25
MLEGIIRESTGKKATKALRKNGYLIANIYGQGLENINAAFKTIEFIKAVKNKTTFAFDAKIDGKTYSLVIQDYQKEPVNYNLLHVDLIIAQPGIVTKYQIPIRTTGTPVGLKNKGVLMQYRKRISVKTDIKNLPHYIELDVSNLEVGDNILVKDLKLDNTKFVIGDTVPVVGVIRAK